MLTKSLKNLRLVTPPTPTAPAVEKRELWWAAEEVSSAHIIDVMESIGLPR